MEYAAIYLPSDGTGKSCRGFYSEDAAWQYVFSQMCGGCKHERDAALNGNKEWDRDREPSEFPGCACEWEVITEGIDDYDIPFNKDNSKWKTSSDF